MSHVLVTTGLQSACLDCQKRLAGTELAIRGQNGPRAVVLIASSREATLASIDQWRRDAPDSHIVAVFCPSSGCHPPELEYFSHGLRDYVSCPWTLRDLQVRLQRLLDATPQRASGNTPGWQASASLIGSSKVFQQLLDQIPLVARSNATVLLTGETGTGKELIARAIHYLSARSAKPFVPLNCGAAPDHLFENELFGHAKGAFTDAGAAEKGLLAEADGGTFFFDEIDSLSFANQVKILRFLQNREYRPLGAARELVADVRIVAATNADLPDLVSAKAFREDLYHRLSVVTLHAPPLRERLDDLPVLLPYFLTRYSGESTHATCEFTPDAVERMMQHHWPGNVRELERVVQRALILARSPRISVDDLSIGPGVARKRQGMGESFQKAKTRAIHAFEFSYLTELLKIHRGNVSSAARAAGKDRRALQRLLEKHGISRVAYLQSA